MDKKNITVTMPLSDYEILDSYKKKYESLVSGLKDCVTVDSSTGQSKNLKTNRVLMIIQSLVFEDL